MFLKAARPDIILLLQTSLQSSLEAIRNALKDRRNNDSVRKVAFASPPPSIAAEVRGAPCSLKNNILELNNYGIQFL